MRSRAQAKTPCTYQAGRAGVALSLVTPRERRRVQKIERYMRSKIPFASLPTAEEQLLIEIRDLLKARA